MKAHTNNFKEQIALLGRELDSKITYTLDNEEIELGSEELNSITPHYEGAILKSVMKQLDIDSNVEIPVGTVLTYQFGVKVGNEYEYIDYGNYVVYSVEKQEDTRSWNITCYDKMLYAMKDYENSDITFPITIKDYLEAICDKVDLTYAGDSFANSNKEIESELYLDSEGRSLGYTFRDVLDEIAQVSGGTICINEDDKLEVRYIKDVGELQTVSGSNITIQKSEATELQEFEIEGNTTQETRSGKNLLKLKYTVNNGITTTINADGSISVSGTATDTYAYLDTGENFNLPAGTYTFSIQDTLTVRPRLFFYNGTSQIATLTIATNSKSTTGTITQSSTSYSLILLDLVAGNSYNFTIKPMLESGSQATSFEPYGQMPSPDYPSELVSVGYENLLYAPNYSGTDRGITTTIQNGIFNCVGTTTTAYYNLCGYTNLKLPIGTYTLSIDEPLTHGLKIRFRNANSTAQTFVIPAGSISVTFTTTDEKIQYYLYAENGLTAGTEINETIYVQLIKGTQLHSYIPYGKYGIEVKTTGKNLFDGEIELGNINPSGGAMSDSTTRTRSKNFIKVKPNTTYVYQHTAGGIRWIVGYNSNFEGITDGNVGNQTSALWMSDNTVLTFSFTTSATTQYIKWYDTNSTNLNEQIMLEEGTQATEYEEYQGNTYLYTLDNPLRSIGDTKDLLYIKNGMLYVDRKIGNVVLNGSENWRDFFSTPGIIVVNLLNCVNSPSTINCMSNYFANTYSRAYIRTHLDSVDKVCATNGEELILANKNISTVNDFKTWLSTHNTKVQYILAETYTEEVGEVQIPSTYEGITYIDANGVMNITYISEFETIDEEYLKDVNVNFGEKFGPVNTLVLSRGGDGDKISLSIPSNLDDESKIAMQITDNQIMNGLNRDEYMPAILNKLYGLEYYINDFSSTGICYLDLCDRYRIKIGDNKYKCIMFNDDVNVTQGLEEFIYTDMQEENEQEYKYMNSTDRGITQANIIAKKNEATIIEYTQKVDDTNNRLNAVETKQTETDRTINIISTNIDTDGNITEVTTTTGFTFNAEGMTIQDSTTNFKALHRNDGTYYKDGDIIVGQYTKDGSKQKDLQLFGVYYYGMADKDDTPMFVAELFTDNNGEEAFGHFYNRGDN